MNTAQLFTPTLQLWLCRPPVPMPTFVGNSQAFDDCSRRRTFTTGIMRQSMRRSTGILSCILHYGTGCLERSTSPNAGLANTVCAERRMFHPTGCCNCSIPFVVDDVSSSPSRATMNSVGLLRSRISSTPHVDGLSINRHARPCLVVLTGISCISAELP